MKKKEQKRDEGWEAKGKGGGVDGWNMNEYENDCGTENVK